MQCHVTRPLHSCWVEAVVCEMQLFCSGFAVIKWLIPHSFVAGVSDCCTHGVCLLRSVPATAHWNANYHQWRNRDRLLQPWPLCSLAHVKFA